MGRLLGAVEKARIITLNEKQKQGAHHTMFGNIRSYTRLQDLTRVTYIVLDMTFCVLKPRAVSL